MPKVLIVEDDDSLRSMYAFKFNAEKFEVRTAAHGGEGLKAAEEFMPDIILLDLKMPVMGGSEMLTLLRDTEWGADIKVIILTNISKSEAPIHIRYLNVERYVVKAYYTTSQIVEIVREVLKG